MTLSTLFTVLSCLYDKQTADKLINKNLEEATMRQYTTFKNVWLHPQRLFIIIRENKNEHK